MAKKYKHYWGEFCNIFGPTPRNRVLEYFLESRELDHSASDVVKETGLNRSTAYLILEDLLNEKIFVPTRVIGKTQLYKLNMEEKKVIALIRAFDELLKGIVEEHTRLEEPLAA